MTLFKWQSGAPDEVHNYSACTILTDATEVQPSLRWISVMAKKKKKKKERNRGLKTVLLLEFSRCINRHFSLKTKQTDARETKAYLVRKKKKKKRRSKHEEERESNARTTREKNIIYTFNECACPELLFLITFPCDIICCKIVYAWGTFSSCQLKSIWTNQYLSILWHTHSWPLGKSCLK